MLFSNLVSTVNYAVPVGVFRNGKPIVNPPHDFILLDTDSVLVFSVNADSAKLEERSVEPIEDAKSIMINSDMASDTVIIGHNETLPIILKELPENVAHVYLVGQNTTEEERDALQSVATNRGLFLDYYDENPHSEDVLHKLAKMASHFVILNDHEIDPEEADLDAIFFLLNLREIRNTDNLNFNITVEMQKEHNQKLVGRGDKTDFLVSSSMSSLILAQLAENPELIGVFQELLSNTGNELFLKSIDLNGEYSVCELRRIMLKQGYILLGHLDAEKHSWFNLPLDHVVLLTPEVRMIVLGQD